MMKFRTLVVACVAQALLVGCGGSDSTNLSPTNLERFAAKFFGGGSGIASVNLTGVVSSGAPLVGVVVSAIDHQGIILQSTLTDANGHYSMDLSGHGPYVLTVPFNDIDGSPAVLSSVYVAQPEDARVSMDDPRRANINPLTSLITARVLGFIPTANLTGDQVAEADIHHTKVANAVNDISTVFQPIYTVLNIPTTLTADPITTTQYQANGSDPLENLFTLARFNISAGQVNVGTGSDRAIVPVPAKGNLSTIPANSVMSLAALGASETRTPIKRLIVVVGENHSFDSVFATYTAPHGQTISNLLSKGIVNTDGTPGPNFSLAQQSQAVDQTAYSINPTRAAPYATLPQPMQTGMYVLPHFNELFGTPDPRFPTNLANGPFQLTKYVPYNVNPRNPIGTVTGDPPHRFFQMWQQTGGNNEQLDMFTWVAVTAGQGGGTSGVTSDNVGQGGELMSFLNMHNLPAVDAPYWKYLAGQYALSDNTHQSIMGGTGINFFAIATADLPYYVDGNGNVATPFDNQIENPNPEPGTPNFYIQDGYEGGSYVNCSDSSQAGVAPILDALAGKNIDSKCEPGKFYLVNNYGLGYDMHGNTLPVGEFNYTLPPQTVPTIAEALTNNGVSWKWYTGGRDIADVEPLAALFGIPVNAAQGLLYNAIGDPLVASQNVMTNPSLKAGLAGLTTFFNDVKTGNLPAVSFVVPMSLYSGHPGYSVQQLYESFLQNVVANVQAHPQMWADTAIILTTDEGGGYFDTGWIQNQDFFGDGPRIPMIVVSPHSRKNFIDHTYHNHVSILKFIQRNWKLDPLSPRSRDNHPIPVTTAADLYRPINTTPTIGDLMTMFDF